MTKNLQLYREANFQIIFQNEKTQNVVELNQTHSNNICSPESINLETSGEDGIIFPINTTQSFAIRTADCIPICYIGHEKIAMIHAGWRGVKSQIFLDDKIKQISPHTIITGPSICDSCFEVTDEFRNEFPNHQNFFYKDDTKLTFRIKSMTESELKVHFPNSKINISNECTLCSPQWHSYRRDKTSKRNFTVFQKR